MAEKKLRSLSIFLVKKDVKSWDEALDYEGSVERLDALGGSGLSGVLVAKSNPGKVPWWKDYVAGSVKQPEKLNGFVNSSSSAALLFKAGSRRFALTFGYGRYLLDLEAVEHDFGLRVVLNTVQHDHIKSVDARTIDDLPMQTQRNASAGSDFEDFGLDVSRDLVRALSGPPRDSALGRNVAGADRLAISTTATPAELPDLCRVLLKHYESSAYKERYGWIDRLRPIKSKGLINDLDDRLLDDLRARRLDNLHLAPPETIDPMRLAGFRYTRKSGDLDPDPRISRYLERIKDLSALSIEKLKRDKVWAYESEAEQLLGSWTVYKCLIYETARDGRLFVLTTGMWFEVSTDFQKKIVNTVNELEKLDVPLPNAPTGISEEDYNKKAADELGLLNLDRQLISIEGQGGRIELCDLLSSSQQLIHVKRRGSSSTLSHLFSQGTVSATLLISDQSFRDRAQAKVAEIDESFCTALPTERPEPASEYEISYAFITRGTPKNENPLTLPFFSLVNLVNAVRQLRSYGFKVSVAQVDEDPS